jgi:LemA protein
MNISASTKWLLAVAGIIALGAIGIGAKYNSLVRQNESVNAQWAQVESQYQRRFDLVPNLVNSVKGVMKQEQSVFDDISKARTQYAGATSPDQKAAAASGLESSLGRLLVIMENYPQLRSVETVQSLMAELSGTENRISVERMRYNDMVRDYNVSIKTFPGSLIAGMFGFSTRTMFEAAQGAQNAPQVQF